MHLLHGTHVNRVGINIAARNGGTKDTHLILLTKAPRQPGLGPLAAAC